MTTNEPISTEYPIFAKLNEDKTQINVLIGDDVLARFAPEEKEQALTFANSLMIAMDIGYANGIILGMQDPIAGLRELQKREAEDLLYK